MKQASLAPSPGAQGVQDAHRATREVSILKWPSASQRGIAISKVVIGTCGSSDSVTVRPWQDVQAALGKESEHLEAKGYPDCGFSTNQPSSGGGGDGCAALPGHNMALPGRHMHKHCSDNHLRRNARIGVARCQHGRETRGSERGTGRAPRSISGAMAMSYADTKIWPRGEGMA
jgi:hypothetical protein